MSTSAAVTYSNTDVRGRRERDDAMGIFMYIASARGGGRERHWTRFVFGQRLLYSCTIKIARPRGRAPDGNSRPFTPFHSLDTAPCIHTYLTTYLYLSTI